jgi:flavin-dependent dehydrogenase
MTPPVLVAGGGLAGAAAACLLAQAGREVTLIEREAGPVEKICGEFVSAEAQATCRRLGLDLAALGGHPIHRLRLVRGESAVACDLPFAGLGLSRRVLDAALLRRAESCGADIRLGRSASLRRTRDPIVVETADGAAWQPEILLLATGKQDLRAVRRHAPAPPDLIGFKLHIRLARAQQAALAGHVEIILLRQGYAGLQMIGDGLANLCLLVERARFQAAGSSWEGLRDDLLAGEPHLCRRLGGASPPEAPPLSIFRVPYGFVHTPSAADPPGIWRLGDQMAVIPSFTGDGMSIALHSAAVAAAGVIGGQDAAGYHRQMRADIAAQIGRAGVLYRLGRAPAGQAALMRAVRLWPGALRLAARLTRVPQAAQARLGA